MAMGREGEVQGDLVMTRAEMPRSPGHAFYDKLQKLADRRRLRRFVQTACKPYYAPRMGAPSRRRAAISVMHMVGYFEGIDSERGIVWRCSDSYSLRDFLRLANRDKVPDHPGCRRRAADCRMRFMRKCSAGSWPWSPSAVW